MEVIVRSDQVDRIGKKILDKIYGKLKKFPGVKFTVVLVDEDWQPRIAVYKTIFEETSVYILNEDFQRFISVIPLDANQFGELFRDWFSENYNVSQFNRLSTVNPSKMQFVNPVYKSRYPTPEL
jgi:hypothetical protein